MNSANIKLSKRFPYFYVIEPAVSDTVQIITGTTFYLTAVSTTETTSGPSGIPSFALIILQNLSLEKYTAVGETVFPNVGGNLGAPYFLPVPWKLEGGTLLRALVDGSPINRQIMLGGYNES